MFYSKTNENEKNKKQSFLDNPKHDATRSSNLGTRKQICFDPVFGRYFKTHVKPLGNLIVPLMRARDNILKQYERMN